MTLNWLDSYLRRSFFFVEVRSETVSRSLPPETVSLQWNKSRSAGRDELFSEAEFEIGISIGIRAS